MRGSVFGFLTFMCSLKGLSCSQWIISVQPHVNGSLGQNVILPCSFTHPKQDTYTGIITVKWFLENKKEPVFHCSLSNKTNSQDGNCTLKSPERLWLHGNPRKQDLSLGISHLQFYDSAKYICRVELDYDKVGRTTELSVNAPAQIIILSLDLWDVKSRSVALKCIAQGNPVPVVKWTSSTGQMKNVSIKSSPNDYLVMTSVLFSEQDVFTCQAVNSLGRAQKKFPLHPPSCSGLLVAIGVLASMLSFGLLVFVSYMIRRRQSAQGVMQPNTGAQQVKTSIYQANETVYANVKACPVGETTQGEMYSTCAAVEEGKREVIPRVQSQRRTLKDRPPRPPTAPVESEK